MKTAATLVLLVPIGMVGPSSAAAGGPPTFVSFEEARPILAAMSEALPAGLKGLSDDRLAAAWPEWVKAQDREVRDRLLRGEADAAVNLLFFGTSFSREPRLTAEALSKQAPEVNDRVFQARLRDLAAALAAAGNGERIELLRALLRRQGIAVDKPGAAEAIRTWLLENTDRVRREQAGFAAELAKARATGDATEEFAARSTLFHDRGIAIDTSLRPAYAIEEALRTALARGQIAKSAVRRVAILGPGLDFADKAEGQDFYPPQSIQSLALIDSLRRLGLASEKGVEAFALDISPAVLDHLQRAGRQAKAGSGYVVQLPRPQGVGWSDGFARYWERFGDTIGERTAPITPPATAGALDVRAVRVRPESAAAVHPLDLNAVYQRLDLPPGERFDLVVATNVLVYYDTFGQCLALANLGRMIAPGGLLLSNNSLLVLPSSAMASAGYATVGYSERKADGDHIVFYRKKP
jgi:hypothetical protein